MNGALLLALVLAHPQGFHKRVSLELWSTWVTALVVMDVDGGDRCELLRAGADLNHDGELDGPETALLKKKLVSLSTLALKLWISDYPLSVGVKEAKVSLKEDARVGPTGVSVAVLLEVRLPRPVTPGMSLWVEDTSPDSSEVQIEVFQHSAADGGGSLAAKQAVASGQRLTVRLGALVSH